ncbi:unnamed protein product [Rotaria sp. Silwood2]|nr:unnamed protein product [Rotaria sp. Silwood2]
MFSSSSSLLSKGGSSSVNSILKSRSSVSSSSNEYDVQFNIDGTFSNSIAATSSSFCPLVDVEDIVKRSEI